MLNFMPLVKSVKTLDACPIPEKQKIAIKAIEYIYEDLNASLNMNTLVEQLETTHRT